jgi:1,4-alpha-glucan branching enzyme
MKWMMGWMNDTLSYFQEDPINRKYHHGKITFSTVYAFTENFMLPFSHDEVVHGKKSLLYKMPGDDWQKYANLRLLYLYMFTHPGTKLMFMGCEFGQSKEWNYNLSLDWHLLEYAPHQGISKIVKSLNELYKTQPALYEKNFSHEGFEWVEVGDAANSILVYCRKGLDYRDELVIAINLTPILRSNYRIGLPQSATWETIFSSDEADFYGSGVAIKQSVKADDIAWNGKANSGLIDLPPLGGVVLRMVGDD